MPTLTKPANSDHLDLVETSLKTEIVDILIKTLPQLDGLNRAGAYQAVMNQPDLLHRSFVTFRGEPHRFETVLRDPLGNPLTVHDDTELSCGESLGRIKTLILRGAARRYFRQLLGGPKTVLVPVKRQIGPVRKMLEYLRLAKAPPPRRKRKPGKGDLLFAALKDHLHYDWQAQLLPHYAQFTPTIVADIGMTLLRIREPTELRALASQETRSAMARGKHPLFLSPARDLMQANGERINGDMLWKLWDQMGLGRLFESVDGAELRKMMAEITATSRSAIEQLVPILGGDVRLFAGFLFTAYLKLGRTEYRAMFADVGNTQWMIGVFAERLRGLSPLPHPELAVMKAVFWEILTSTNKLAR